MARLEIVTGGHTGKRFDFTDEVRLGRSPDNDFCLPDVRVSRYHARITRNGPHFILEDLHSRNGTSRRGTRLLPATPCLLASGDEFDIGSIRLVFYDDISQEPPENQAPVANDKADQPDRTIKLDVQSAGTLSLRWIEDDAISASVVATRDAAIDLPQALPDTRSTPLYLRHMYRRLQAMCQISMKIGMITDLPTLMPKVLDCLFDIYPGAARAAMLYCCAQPAAPTWCQPQSKPGVPGPSSSANWSSLARS